MFCSTRQFALVLVLAGLVSGCSMEKGGWTNGALRAQHPPAEHDAATEPPALPADVDAFNNAMDDMASLRYAEAETKLRALLPRFETSGSRSFSAKTLFWLGYAAEKQHRPAEARQYYNRLVEDYPQAEPADQAKQRLAGPVAPIRPDGGETP